ncbi:unnamed protein product [Hyaloperonospora brassicae]|uniref:Ubiquitin-like domain-containing protein n=1 Tax=Hyaloperonospora brassicae TaxID=162125 RepID=A0AAV0SWX6_HYABA|nr:unnamed protein product [Hyaloperonospora brassicae]
MPRLQCLLCAGDNGRVVTIEVSSSERIGVLQDLVHVELNTMGFQAESSSIMKLYCVQHQRLTYRPNLTTKTDALYLDHAAVSVSDASCAVVLLTFTPLVQWALVSWYFSDQQFTFPDVVDIVVVWEDVE